MKIGIIGTGAMGCLFGGYLSRRADVTLLTHRKQQAQAIEETGLSIQTDEGPVACGTLRAVCAAEVSEVFDLLVVFVKAFQTRDAIESIRGCIGPETIILTLQNGIGNGQTLQQLFRPEQILVGTSTINSQRLSDTAVSQHGGMGITTIGSLCGKTALAEQTAAFFTSCGFCAEASTNIDGLIWKKAFINLTINPLTALFDRPIGMVEQCEEAGRRSPRPSRWQTPPGRAFPMRRSVILSGRSSTARGRARRPCAPISMRAARRRSRISTARSPHSASSTASPRRTTP